MSTIGFVGLGIMGAPMAAHLLAAGHEVTGCDAVPRGSSCAADLASRRVRDAGGVESADGGEWWESWKKCGTTW